MAKSKKTESPYSFQSTVDFINNQFAIILMVIIAFIAGFVIGSLWTETQVGGKALGNSAAQPTAAAPTTAPNLTDEALTELAVEVGADKAAFTECYESDSYRAEITAEQSGGSAVGVTGTPGTVIVVNGQPKEIINGALPYTLVSQVVQEYLDNPNGTGLGAALNAQNFKAVAADSFEPITGDDHIKGDANATVVLVEYSDYECPFCQRFHATAQQVVSEFDDVAWVYRHFPLTSHPRAVPAAQAAECVNELEGNDAFWEFTDSLFAS